MRTAIFNKLIGSVIRRGRLEVVHVDGSVVQFGEPADGFPEIRVRFDDAKVARDILLDPRLGAAEAYMDGRLIVERGDIMGLVQLLRSNAAWERGGNLKRPALSRRVRNRLGFVLEF